MATTSRMSELEITPEGIKDIRVSLGLTQVEAGELLGGGPPDGGRGKVFRGVGRERFTKYDRGYNAIALGIAPEEIKDIRVSLGLTQVEAGELHGGGV